MLICLQEPFLYLIYKNPILTYKLIIISGPFTNVSNEEIFNRFVLSWEAIGRKIQGRQMIEEEAFSVKEIVIKN